MSDTQDPLIVLQHRMQQRQILAMMGINQWVQSNSETINVADISAPVVTDTAALSVASHTNTEPRSVTQSSVEDLDVDMSSLEVLDTNILDTDISDNEILDSLSVNEASNIVDEDAIGSYYFDAPDTALSPSSEQNSVIYRFDTTTPDTPIVETTAQQPTHSVKSTQSTDSYYDNNLKVAPFDLQGGRYGNWVILADIQALNKDSQKLWENITQALSITCETTSFPICEGMDTAELANASLAGYIFKIGRSEDIQVAALTTLPDGLEHPNLTTVPTLDEMLAESGLKRQFWEQLSE